MRRAAASCGLPVLALVCSFALLGAEPPAAPSPVPSVLPSASPAPVEAPTAAAPASVLAAPQIISATIDPDHLVSHEHILITVTTTSDVVGVKGQVARHGFTVPQVAPGDFVAEATMPWIPFFFHGHYQVTFRGQTAAGTQVTRQVPISVN